MAREAPAGFEPVTARGAPIIWRLGPRATPGGAAPAIVLLPGIEGDARVFARQLPLARSRAVYAIDLPEGRSLDELGRGVLSALDALGLGQVAVVGASLGGLVGRAMVARAPGRVRALVALGALPARACLPRAVSLGAAALACTPPALFRLQYRRRIDARLAAEGVPEALRHLLTSALPERDTLRARLAAIRAWGLPETIDAPALWLRGATDVEAPWGAAEVHRHLPGVDFATVPGGHRAALTHPDGLHDAVGAFLAARI